MNKDDFDDQLTRALQRVDASQEFAARLMAQAEAIAPQPAKVLTMRPRTTQRPFWAGAIAAALLLGVFGAEGHLHREHQATLAAERSQRATQQFELATQITDRALAHTRAELLRAGVPLGD